jgi:small subunit ribosomal protein S1
MTRKGLTTNEGDRSVEQDLFAQLLGSFDYAFHRGELVKGTVVGYESSGALIDIGAKTAAYMPVKELGAPTSKKIEELLKVGESHEFLILREENEEGQLTVSLRRVQAAHNWKKLEQMMIDEAVIDCPVTSVVKGGLLVDVMGLRGFVPASHLRVKQTIDSLVGQTLPLKILNLDTQRNNIILSHRKVMSEQMAEQRKELFENLQVGSVVEGEVVRLTDFGAFVDLGGVDGLLPLSQMSWRWVEHPSDVLKISDMIKVEVIGLDMDRQRVSLSIKSQFSDPWNEVADAFRINQEVTGTITRIKHFGAFVEVYPGVEALLPSKDMVDYENFHKVKLDIGQVIQTAIQKFNPEERRISLGFTTNVEGGVAATGI